MNREFKVGDRVRFRDGEYVLQESAPPSEAHPLQITIGPNRRETFTRYGGIFIEFHSSLTLVEPKEGPTERAVREFINL
jgi:hypothetical protein